jgi:hypothetical protein
MDGTLEVKQELHSDYEIDPMSLQDEALSLNIKKEPGDPNSSVFVKISHNTQVYCCVYSTLK